MMGVSHLSPTATRNQYREIVTYDGYHADVSLDWGTFETEQAEESIIRTMTERYGFEELIDGHEWVGEYEKIVAETRHGVQLRALYHPSGTTIYWYVVVVANNRWGERDPSGLGAAHLHTYKDGLLEAVRSAYGDAYRKKTAWTSEKVEG